MVLNTHCNSLRESYRYIKIRYGLRMSNTGQNSLLTNFLNKIKYNIYKVSYDPDANIYAQQQIQEQQEKQKEQQQTQPQQTTDTSDPNKFSTLRFIKKTSSRLFSSLIWGGFIFMALMLAMIVSNELIVYSAPIRIIFFVFVFIICLFLPPISIILGIFYLLKGGYSYYVNNMTNRPKEEIMPTIYALLPISKPSSSFFMYPFSYPKSETIAQQLPKTMENYINSLKASFTDFDTMQKLPIFAEGFKKLQDNLMQMHNNNISQISNNLKNNIMT